MKNILPILCLLLISAAPAYAEECLLSKEAIIPVMKHGAPDHRTHYGRDQRAITETAKTKDGTKVTYTASGCSNFVFEYKFENIPGGVPKEPDDPFTLPLKLMASIPFRDQFDAEAIVKALKEKQASNHAAFDDKNSTDLPCGDNVVCALTLGPDKVSITYDLTIN